MTTIYQLHNPAKLIELPALFDKYSRKEEGLFGMYNYVIKKYITVASAAAAADATAAAAAAAATATATATTTTTAAAAPPNLLLLLLPAGIQ